MNRDAIALALISALLFGASTPAAKALLVLSSGDPRRTALLRSRDRCGALCVVCVDDFFPTPVRPRSPWGARIGHGCSAPVSGDRRRLHRLGLDNKLTRRVSLAESPCSRRTQGADRGPRELGLGFIAGGYLPDLLSLMAAGLIGFLGYGVSLAFFVLALPISVLRGQAPTSDGTFFGAVVAIVFLREPLTLQLLMAGLLMAVGVWLHVTEHHEHEHVPRSHGTRASPHP